MRGFCCFKNRKPFIEAPPLERDDDVSAVIDELIADERVEYLS
jgi:hypothetical protein